MENHYYDDRWPDVHTSHPVTEKQIKKFIERVIPTFEEQRVRSQFATIILCSKEDYQSGFTTVTFSPTDELDKPVLDYTKQLMPEIHMYDNYLCARPSSSGLHAESTLLERIDYLLAAYIIKNRVLPACIVLYSWITPCSDCTQKIIEKLCSHPYDNIPKVVAYTTNTHKRGDNVEEARERLRDNGITVQCVPYPKLPIRNKPLVSI